MKRLSCRDLGGPCDHKITGTTFEEIGRNIRAHVMRVMEDGDAAHREAAERMRQGSPEEQAGDDGGVQAAFRRSARHLITCTPRRIDFESHAHRPGELSGHIRSSKRYFDESRMPCGMSHSRETCGIAHIGIVPCGVALDSEIADRPQGPSCFSMRFNPPPAVVRCVALRTPPPLAPAG